ncbi:uncharacterized protein LOC115240109, partial [Formica exsecta]|uniref:uncharacterized protein LOC115240109 n=1 Tax=Formica exsecta TaxID=72781 RepID=UPI0011451A98
MHCVQLNRVQNLVSICNVSICTVSNCTVSKCTAPIFAAIKHFKHVLESRKFIIRTDHKPLIHAFLQRADKASPRQLRQLDLISQFSTEIIHVNGKENVVADALSRIEAIGMPTVLSPQTIMEEQQSDQEFTDLLSNGSSFELQQLAVEPDVHLYCDVSNNIVRPFISHSLRRTAFNTIYGLAHPSGRVTCRQLKEKYVWSGIRKNALQWSRECLQCQKSKIQCHTRMQPNDIVVPDNRFNHVHLDIIHLPEIRGFKYCLTIIDRFSRFPIAIPLKDITATTVASAFFDNWFESALFNALTNTVVSKRIHTTPYHPASNGIIERWHRTLKASLMCHSGTPWLDIVPTVLLGLRTAYKEDIKASPAEMLFGTTLRIPGDFFIEQDPTADPEIFLEKHREYMKSIRPTPTVHHIKAKMFVLQDLYICSHVFLRQDE